MRTVGQHESPPDWFTCPACHHVWVVDASIPAHAAPSRPLAADDRKHIVVVDDEPPTLRLVEWALSGYRVSTASSGSAALTILSSAEPVHLLVTDFLMPAMSGRALVQQARLLRPELAVLIMTGLASGAAAEPAWWASEPHLAKPFHLETLRAVVESLIG